MSDGTQIVLAPLPCPLCGALPETMIREFDGRHFIFCNGAEGRGHRCLAAAPTYAEALAIWNHRSALEPPAAPDVEAFKKAWNDNCGPLPRVTKLTGDRLHKLKSRIKEGLALETFTRAAWICSHTEFLLRGTPKVEFHATFDWLLSNSGVIAKVLEGQYGATGKTEEELRAEAAEQEQRVAKETDDGFRVLSEKMKQGGKCTPDLQTAVFLWELRQARDAGETDAVYAMWVDRMSQGVKLSGAVVFRLKQWERQRVTQATTAT